MRIVTPRVDEHATAAYLDWREQCVAVADAYKQWTRAPASEAALGYAAYEEALDREERASEAYQLTCRR